MQCTDWHQNKDAGVHEAADVTRLELEVVKHRIVKLNLPDNAKPAANITVSYRHIRLHLHHVTSISVATVTDAHVRVYWTGICTCSKGIYCTAS